MLTNTLRNYIDAAFSGLWIESYEPLEAIREMTELCKAESWNLVTWNIDQGFTGTDTIASDPLSAVKAIGNLDNSETPLLVVLQNFHRFLGSIEIVQTLERQIQDGKTTRTFVIVLSPVVQIPVELEKLFTVIEHELPNKEQLKQIATEIIADDELPDDVTLHRVINAAAGMTRLEAENAFSLSIVEHDSLSPETIWQLKSNMLKQSSALSLYRGEVPTLGGLDNLTHFCNRALTSTGHNEKAKGVMLLGISGSGKSAFCKRLGHLVHRPTLVLDVGGLMGSLVGQTESALRKALKQIEAMSPCVVMIDEIEKAITTGGNDGGVSTRILGTILQWLNDRESDSFVVCTANDISKLPPELCRAERFDGIFFVDLPDRSAKDQIWSIYEREYGLENPKHPDDEGWTGAEIKACCRLSKLLDVSLIEAALNIVPVIVARCYKPTRQAMMLRNSSTKRGTVPCNRSRASLIPSNRKRSRKIKSSMLSRHTLPRLIFPVNNRLPSKGSLKLRSLIH